MNKEKENLNEDSTICVRSNVRAWRGPSCPWVRDAGVMHVILSSAEGGSLSQKLSQSVCPVLTRWAVAAGRLPKAVEEGKEPLELEHLKAVKWMSVVSPNTIRQLGFVGLSVRQQLTLSISRQPGR